MPQPAQLGPGLRGGGEGRSRLLLLFAAALLLRALDLGNPVIHVDEEFYFVTARAMAHGALPYIDVWDRKPVGLFLLYLPAAALPWRWGIVAYQLMALASAVGTAWLIARLADRAGWAKGATVAGIAYLIWLDLLGGVGGQAPVFYNLLMAGAGTLALASRRAGLAAMALIGLALQVKYSVVFEGMALGLYLLWRHWTGLATAVAQAALLIAVALLPTAAALGAYAALGQAPAFVYANFTSIFARVADPWPERLGNAATLALILSPLVAMAFAGGATFSWPLPFRGGDGGGGSDPGAALGSSPHPSPSPEREGLASIHRFLRGWFAVAVAGVALFGGWFDHYGLPVLVPGCACAAGFFTERQRLGAIVLGLATAIGLARVAIDRHNRGDGAQLAALAQAIGPGAGCLYVYSGETMLYPATGRCPVSTRLFPSHLSRAREANAVGLDQATEVRRILTVQPAVVVMRPPYRGERPAIRALVSLAVHQRYRLAARLPMGREQVEVWRRSPP